MGTHQLPFPLRSALSQIRRRVATFTKLYDMSPYLLRGSRHKVRRRRQDSRESFFLMKSSKRATWLILADEEAMIGKGCIGIAVSSCSRPQLLHEVFLFLLLPGEPLLQRFAKHQGSDARDLATDG
ncbi:MAG TPA: hypothetical protein VFA10_28240 [Ktedonobacteraceae bacterium]|nr:hypothetical protein [Ktedonobacteraceae bacterium]